MELQAGPRTWKGCEKKVVAAPADKVWRLASDFCGLSKWAGEVLDYSELVEGEAQVPGCVRRVASGSGAVEERLLEMNNDEHRLKYMVEKNSFNLEGLVGTFQLSEHQDGTLVDWSYEMPASEAITEEDVSALMVSCYKSMLATLSEMVEAGPAADDADGGP